MTAMPTQAPRSQAIRDAAEAKNKDERMQVVSDCVDLLLK